MQAQPRRGKDGEKTVLDLLECAFILPFRPDRPYLNRHVAPLSHRSCRNPCAYPMRKLGTKLIRSAQEARSIARGEAKAASYRIRPPGNIDVQSIRMEK
jgi:hypothetical protein